MSVEIFQPFKMKTDFAPFIVAVNLGITIFLEIRAIWTEFE